MQRLSSICEVLNDGKLFLQLVPHACRRRHWLRQATGHENNEHQVMKETIKETLTVKHLSSGSIEFVETLNIAYSW